MMLDELVKELNKKKKYNLINDGNLEIKVPKISFISPFLNYMTHGGIPRGYITEFSGEESSGKTTTALSIVANAQKLFNYEFENGISKVKKYVLYVDCENTFNSSWARLLGVNIEDLKVLSPQEEYAEEIFEIILDFIHTGEIGLVILDSLGVMVSKQAFEKDIEQKTYGGISMPLTLFSKKAIMSLKKFDCTLIGINQVRMDLASLYPGAMTTTGGKAWKHNCMLRLSFKKGHYINNKNEEISKSKASVPEGNIVEVVIEKSKSCKPDRRHGRYILNYTKGVDIITDIIYLCKLYNLIIQKGSWFYFYDENGEVANYDGQTLSFQGEHKLYNFIEDHTEFYDSLVDSVKELYV